MAYLLANVRAIVKYYIRRPFSAAVQYWRLYCASVNFPPAISQRRICEAPTSFLQLCLTVLSSGCPVKGFFFAYAVQVLLSSEQHLGKITAPDTYAIKGFYRLFGRRPLHLRTVEPHAVRSPENVKRNLHRVLSWLRTPCGHSGEALLILLG